MTDRAVTDDKVIEVREVWKIFGARASEALAAIRKEGLDKAEVLERFESVVGVRDVSFDVNAGEIFCVMGLSGSGKSTLVRHVNRLIEPTHGRILINGEDVGALSPEELRALRADRIGMVFQNMALLPHRTVRDNVAFALELRNADTFTRHQVADRVIETVSLQGYGDRMPSELSGRDAAAGRARPRPRRGPRDPAHGRALLGPRPPHPPRPPGRVPGALAHDEQDERSSSPTTSTKRSAWARGSRS